MNIFNKVVVIILLLFTACLSLLAIVNEFIGYFKWSDIALTVFNPDMGINPFISSLILLFIFALSLFLLLMEFYRRRSRIATVYKVKNGNAMISLDSVAQQIKCSGQTLEGVDNIKVKITPKSRGAIIDMAVDLSQNINIPEKMQQVIDTAQDITQNKLGIKVLKTNLTIANLVQGQAEQIEEKPTAAEELPSMETKVEPESQPEPAGQDK